MARKSCGKSARSDWLFLGRDFTIRTVSLEIVISLVFLFMTSGKFENLQLNL